MFLTMQLHLSYLSITYILDPNIGMETEHDITDCLGRKEVVVNDHILIKFFHNVGRIKKIENFYYLLEHDITSLCRIDIVAKLLQPQFHKGVS